MLFNLIIDEKKTSLVRNLSKQVFFLTKINKLFPNIPVHIKSCFKKHTEDCVIYLFDIRK